MQSFAPSADERNSHIELVNIKPFHNSGNLKAFASVRLGGVTIHDCRIGQQPRQRCWVSLPQREYTQDGQKKYAPVVELSEPLKREGARIVLAAWEQGGAR